MTTPWLGALVGGTAGAGGWMAVRASPPMRPIRLQERIAPYLADTPPPSRLLAAPASTSAPFVVLRRVLGPLVGDAIGLLDRAVGGSASVRRRLDGLGRATTVEEFRLEQVLWGAVGLLLGGLGATAVTWLRGSTDPVLAGVAALIGLAAGVFGRDWWLSRELARREEVMMSEFPIIADLLALAVVAGEAPVDALARVCRLTDGEVARELAVALARARSGEPIARALTEIADRSTVEAFSRFVQGFVVALERGTPLADVLRAQAADVREVGKRALLDAGGKKEISMMAPVVFLILPTTVLFALYPGLLTLVSLTQ